MLKKGAQLIVKRQYTICNVARENNTAEVVALKVQGPLDDDAHPSNMGFTDGPSDHNVNQFSFFSK